MDFLYYVWTILGLFVCRSWQADVIVDTVYGPVQGHTVSLGNDEIEDGYVNSFLAVPFAKPPVGELRWQPPQEPDPWDLYVADELGSACIQSLIGEIVITHPGWLNFNESCLHLNIYTPEDMNNGPYPVMVFLHGGAYQSSANIQYPGHFLVTRDVIAVVPNYRLGIFGFASTGDEAAPGNFGMLDQLQALKFVKENIANFGGDPDRVTIFGQSAGAGSVGLMMMSPMAQGYFHQAILHSGSELAVWAVNGDEVNPHNWIHEVAVSLSCESDNNQEVMDCLRNVGPWRLHNANFNCSFCLGFAPVVDGQDGFLPDRPINIRQSGEFAKVPLMEGITREDGFLYALVCNLTDFEGVSREDFEMYLRAAVELFDYLIGNDELKEDIYQALLFYYSPWPHLYDEPANLHELGMDKSVFVMFGVNQLITDVAYGYPSDEQIKHHTQFADTYYYVFGFRGDNTGDILPEWMGVPHIMDLPYVFGFPMLQHSPAVRNDTQMFIDPIDWTNEDRQYADFTMDLWTNFAKHGNPTPEPIRTPQNNEVTWEQWTEAEYNYLYLANEAVETRVNYRQRDYAFWTSYLLNMALDGIPNSGSKQWQVAHRRYTAMLADQVLQNLAQKIEH